MKYFIYMLLAIFLFLLIACESNDNKHEEEKIEPPRLNLHTAIYMRDLDAIRQHIEAGSDINLLENSRKSTPLITAAALDEADAAKILIEAGAKLNYQNSDGATALITAAAFGQTNTAKVLIDSGADINIQNNDGSTALHTAAFLCNIDMVKELIKAGADKSIKNNRGNTAYDAVTSPFEEVKPIYDKINEDFEIYNVKYEYEFLKNSRPIIAELLKE